MMVRIGLVCLAGWTLIVGAVAQCGGGEGIWYTEEPPSVEASMLSFEEASDEYYQVRRHPRHQQQHRSRVRSSRYTPGGYGYGTTDYELERTWEKQPAARKPLYGDRRKSRRQQGSYASRSQRTDYNYQVAPVTEAAVYERRKANRAAKYSGPDDGPGSGHKTATVAYKVLPPKPSCAQNLLIGCTPTVTRVPCSGSLHEGYGAAPYYPPAPMAYSYHEPAAPYGSPGYEPHPAGYHQPPAAYQKPAPTEFHQHPAGSEGLPPGYVPSYKSATGEELPGFAAPVREDLSESPKVPIISAFSKAQDPQSTTATANEATSSAPLSRAALPSNGTQPSQELGPAPHSATPMPALAGTTEPKEDSNAEFWNDTESSTDAVEATTAS